MGPMAYGILLPRGRNQTHIPYIGRILNHCYHQEVPIFILMVDFKVNKGHILVIHYFELAWMCKKEESRMSTRLQSEKLKIQFTSVSCVRLFVTPWDCSMPGLPVQHQLLELTQTHVHWARDAIQPPHPLSPPSPPSLNLSQHQGLFKWVSFCIRWPKYWSFSFNISPPNE